uniref:FMN-binding protein n=1 Tax=Candidatus Scatomorpha intestinigallinarum TaxID=2840923 RepID=UPI0040272479
MSKKLLVPVAVILACAVILAAAGAGLAGTAAANAEKELGEMISYLLPGGGEFEEIEYKGTDSKITNVYKGEGGYVLAMTANGYVDEIKLLVAVDNEGVVKGYTVRDIHDTYGLGLGVQDDLFFLVGLMNSKGDLAVNSNIDAVTGATISSSAVVACVNAASKYVQESGAAGGPLTGTANGFGGPITVSVTMDGDKITAVEIVSNSETPEIAGTALEQIPAAIVAANSPDVDIVSGATYTSNGIINAVKNALDSAGGGSGALTGTADGFIGPITVAVTMDGDTITAVEVISNSETIEIAGGALEQIPAAIVAANSPDVDVVSGATYTSNGIINAVKNALAGGGSSEPEPEATPRPTQEAQVAAEAYQGFGLSNTVRMGPGSDDTGTPVYSINQVFANTLFDSEGRITAIYVDQLEYATPNYDGAEMPHFSGWPGQGGYNNDSNHDAVVDGTTPDTEEQFTEEVAGWATKRDRGETYVMGTGTWSEQMDAFQQLFVGKTVDEVEEWFAKYCSDANGRPLKESSSGEGDAEKYAALTDEEKAMLADVTSSATMSLNDSHGDILSAIRKAYENRVPLGAMTATGMGFGLSNTVRMGPGSDDTG